MILSRPLVRRAAATHPNVPVDLGAIRRVLIDDLAWLSATRLVVLMRLRIERVGLEELVAIFENGRARVVTVPIDAADLSWR